MVVLAADISLLLWLEDLSEAVKEKVIFVLLVSASPAVAGCRAVDAFVLVWIQLS